MKVHISWDLQLFPKKRPILSGAMMQIGTFYQVRGKIKTIFETTKHIMMVVDGEWICTNHTSIKNWVTTYYAGV